MSLPQPRADLRIGGGARSFMGLAGALAFVVFGLALIFAPHSGVVQKVVGGFEIAFFGPLPLHYAYRLRRAGCIYIFAADGIRFPMHGWPTLPWSEVQGTRIITRRGRRYLAIYAQNAEARVAGMRRGARMARWNLRNGLGLVAIPEQQAPTSLEALQAEVASRQSPVSVEPVFAQPPGGAGATILPVSVSSRAQPAAGGFRSLRIVAGLHGLTLLLSAAGGHHSARHQILALGLGGALLLGAWLVAAEPVAGIALVIASEAVLVVLDLSSGHHIALATRVLYLFMSVCVLLLAAQAWPRRD